MRHRLVLLPVLVATLVCAPPALAWTWPAEGPVLQPFVLGGDPYAAGQHRGIDVAGPPGASVRAPTSGIVSFAGFVPSGGRTVTIQTADGLAVTLLHLGSVGVARGASVAESDAVGTLSLGGDADHLVPYVQMGVRVAADPQGYLDPLTFLPERVPAETPGAPVDEPMLEPAEEIPGEPLRVVPEVGAAPPAPGLDAADPSPPGTPSGSVVTAAGHGASVEAPPRSIVRTARTTSRLGVMVRPNRLAPVESAKPSGHRVPADPELASPEAVVPSVPALAGGRRAFPALPVAALTALLLGLASLTFAWLRRAEPPALVRLPPRVTPRLRVAVARVTLPGTGTPLRRHARSGPHANSAVAALFRRARRKAARAR